MYLNDGAIVISSEEIKQNYGSVKNMLKRLVASRNMIADIVVNSQKQIASSLVSFSDNSGYVIANVDAHVAFEKIVDVSSIEISIHPANTPEKIIINSYTDGVLDAIPAGDVDADLYFKVGSLYPYNELKFEPIESKFHSMRSNTMQPISYDLLPSIVSGGSEDDSETYTVSFNSSDCIIEVGDVAVSDGDSLPKGNVTITLKAPQGYKLVSYTINGETFTLQQDNVTEYPVDLDVNNNLSISVTTSAISNSSNDPGEQTINVQFPTMQHAHVEINDEPLESDSINWSITDDLVFSVVADNGWKIENTNGFVSVVLTGSAGGHRSGTAVSDSESKVTCTVSKNLFNGNTSMSVTAFTITEIPQEAVITFNQITNNNLSNATLHFEDSGVSYSHSLVNGSKSITYNTSNTPINFSVELEPVTGYNISGLVIETEESTSGGEYGYDSRDGNTFTFIVIPDTDKNVTLNVAIEQNEEANHIVSVALGESEEGHFEDGNNNILNTLEWDTSSQLDFYVVTNENFPSGDKPAITVDGSGEVILRDSESDNPPYYQFHIRSTDIGNIENISELTLCISYASNFASPITPAG